MKDQYIVKHCSPTLAGLKTGSLFSVSGESKEKLNSDLRCLNEILRRKGLRVIPLRYTDKYVLIYLYRLENLKKDLMRSVTRSILCKKGYNCTDPDKCVVQLVKHIKDDKDFPHEIGFFLGYPEKDVKGFMNSPEEGVLSIGYWKVYGDVEEAEQTFKIFNKCTEVYCKALKHGKSLEQLIVTA
ncbi:MAG: DUF3793 family protein [Lachnospiraceae bacterium]|jgi:hypothetical protein|nr:DUF3793 family protein [Lachnospiraceae bacterium]